MYWPGTRSLPVTKDCVNCQLLWASVVCGGGFDDGRRGGARVRSGGTSRRFLFRPFELTRTIWLRILRPLQSNVCVCAWPFHCNRDARDTSSNVCMVTCWGKVCDHWLHNFNCPDLPATTGNMKTKSTELQDQLLDHCAKNKRGAHTACLCLV